jgi:hypothetical protein
MRYWLFFLFSLSIAGVAGADSPGPYQPLVFLAGSCWKGNLPTAGQTDEHCFSWMYGGKFLRDRHTVRSAGQPDHLGESIYFWNSEAKQLEYLYVESDGGFSRGVVSVQSDAVVFPPTPYIEEGHTSSYRSRWREVGADAYEVVTEFQSGDSWKEGWRVHMVRNGEASP